MLHSAFAFLRHVFYCHSSLFLTFILFDCSVDPAAEKAAEARQRLLQSEAGQIILESVRAHGGYDSWYNGRALRFRYDYRPVDGMVRNSIQTVNLMNSQVYHRLDEPVSGSFAFDGEQVWSTFPPEQFQPRFWALTPYYFVAIPFVLGDPGVHLEMLDEDPAAAGFSPGPVVGVSFGEDVGDAPDDTYIIYIDGETGLLQGLRYTVTYRPFFANRDMERSAESLIVYEDYQQAGPLLLARKHTYYDFSARVRGGLKTEATVSEMEYAADFDASKLEKPNDAMIDTSLDPYL